MINMISLVQSMVEQYFPTMRTNILRYYNGSTISEVLHVDNSNISYRFMADDFGEEPVFRWKRMTSRTGGGPWFNQTTDRRGAAAAFLTMLSKDVRQGKKTEAFRAPAVPVVQVERDKGFGEVERRIRVEQVKRMLASKSHGGRRCTGETRRSRI